MDGAVILVVLTLLIVMPLPHAHLAIPEPAHLVMHKPVHLASVVLNVMDMGMNTRFDDI